MKVRTALVLGYLFLLAGVASAASTDGSSPTRRGPLPPEKANPVAVKRFDTPPTIDGRLDDRHVQQIERATSLGSGEGSTARMKRFQWPRFLSSRRSLLMRTR